MSVGFLLLPQLWGGPTIFTILHPYFLQYFKFRHSLVRSFPSRVQIHSLDKSKSKYQLWILLRQNNNRYHSQKSCEILPSIYIPISKVSSKKGTIFPPPQPRGLIRDLWGSKSAQSHPVARSICTNCIHFRTRHVALAIYPSFAINQGVDARVGLLAAA